ncbi:oxysterol binding protein [Schizosaccharomyces octosporus yFS286]|uniref:Oxysterol binding protein n=1 Tax=Schizosaccharomyces octosporus (strain yFS286) TaxID=483514 RepID=S9QZ52_SCHOY|nr:oxysterol binding protein [Schizosaccharomyces octosporus yFS286]EPX71540.1 oxysterol binding protein [Schizosaccharomyces octosporus yFS286]
MSESSGQGAEPVAPGFETISKSSWMGFIKNLATFTGDLSTLSAPSFILSGTSLLEYMSYWFEFPELFVSIVDHEHPKDRMLAVLKWYMAGLSREYASRNKSYGTEKKPLNPILGELYYGSWDSSKGKVELVAEQVSHHGPVSAARVHCKEAGISVDTHNMYRSGFSGRTVYVNQIGQIRIHLDKFNETYYLTLPNISLEGLWYMTPYIELYGSTYIVSTSNYITKIDYSGRGYFSGTKNSFKATVYEKGANPDYVAEGVWTGTSKVTDTKSKTTSPFLDYGTMDAIPILPRPYSEVGEWETRHVWGKVSSALARNAYDIVSVEKSTVEQSQRDMRKREQEEGVEWKRRYFEWKPDESSARNLLAQAVQEIIEPGYWVYVGDTQPECKPGDHPVRRT